MKTYEGGEVLILNLRSRWRSASPSGRLTTGNEPRYPLSRMLDGQQSRYGHYEEEKNIFSCAGIRTLDCSALSLVTIHSPDPNNARTVATFIYELFTVLPIEPIA